jgi:hypothetical protein
MDGPYCFNQGRKPIFKISGRRVHDAAHVVDLKKRKERTGASNKELEDRLTTVLNELREPCARRRRYDANSSPVREALV